MTQSRGMTQWWVGPGRGRCAGRIVRARLPSPGICVGKYSPRENIGAAWARGDVMGASRAPPPPLQGAARRRMMTALVCSLSCGVSPTRPPFISGTAAGHSPTVPARRSTNGGNRPGRFCCICAIFVKRRLRGVWSSKCGGAESGL